MRPSCSIKSTSYQIFAFICISSVVFVTYKSSYSYQLLPTGQMLSNLPILSLNLQPRGHNQSSSSSYSDPASPKLVCPDQKVVQFRSLRSFFYSSVATTLRKPTIILISNAATWVDCGNVLIGLEIPQKVLITGFYNESQNHDLKMAYPFWFKYDPHDRIKDENEIYSWNVINVVGVFSLDVRFIWDSSVKPIVVENRSPLPTSFEEVQSFIEKSTFGLPITEQLIATSDKSICGKDIPNRRLLKDKLVHFLT